MAGDVEGQEPIESDDNDADFAAGLTGNAPTETPVATPEPTPAPSPEPTPAPTEAPKYVQITREEWNATKSIAARVEEINAQMGKGFDKAFGKLGSFEDLLKKLQTETPAGKPVEVSDEDFAELKEQYPELAEVQIKGLNKVLSRFKGTADQESIDKLIQPRMKEARDEFLEIAFPGWRDDVKTQDFADWRKAQGPAVEALVASDSYADAAKLLRMFYARTKSAPTPEPTQPPKPTPVPTRTRQIAAAVPPKGDGGNPPGPSEEDDFIAGLRYRGQ